MPTQDLFEALESGMLERLRDKQPAVRAHASRVLARIAQPLEEVRAPTCTLKASPRRAWHGNP
jgi:hypothetical protein